MTSNSAVTPSPDNSGRTYPIMAAEADRMEPAPRRVRATLNGETVFDTIHARYVWEWPYYPQYYIPLADVEQRFLVEGRTRKLRRGSARSYGLQAGDEHRPHAVDIYEPDADAIVAGHAKFSWDALDSWFEEDEQIFVHPRNPYVRVDALRSHRAVRIELEGVVLAETLSPVMLFETGLPTRYYIDRTDVRHEHLVPSDTQTPCPYKGVTSGYWSVRIGDTVHEDLVWAYDYPTDAVRPIAGMMAFYDEKVDVFLDGVKQPRPVTHFFRPEPTTATSD